MSNETDRNRPPDVPPLEGVTNGPAPDARQAESELETLRQELAAQRERVQALVQENDSLRRQNQTLAVQREEYRESLYAVLRDYGNITEEEIERELNPATRTGVTFEELMRELHDHWNRQGKGDVG